MNQPELPPDLDHIRHILTRDLDALSQEVRETPDGLLWKGVPGFTNSVGTLAIHLCGNLRHFIGHEIGGDGFVRDRNAEFSGDPLPKATLLTEIQTAQNAVDSTLSALPAVQLDEPMPNPPPHHRGRSIRFFLMQLSCHLSRHTGQANALRRILTAQQNQS